MRDKIKTIIQANTKKENYQLNNVNELSKELKVSRNQIASIVRQLFSKGILLKVSGSQVFYLDKEVAEAKVDTVFEKNEFSSLDEIFYNTNAEKRDFQKLIGYEGSLSELVKQCKGTIAYPPKGLPMLLYGSTGTGKSYIAKLTYEYAKNEGLLTKNKRFISVNCSEYANNPELLTANLFGHVKGAFTGAEQDNEGLIQLADGGILFLDEVHNLSPECQEKLFQFMDLSEFHRVGDNDKWYTSEVRLIFATTEKPERVLLKTLLRRIPMTITVPSLKARGLHERVQLLYAMFKSEEERLNKTIKISSKVYNILLSYDFVGNIGGLQGCIQTCCINALFDNQNESSLVIQLHNLPKNILKSDQLHNESISLEVASEYIDISGLESYVKTESYIIQMFNNLLEKFINYESKKLTSELLIEQGSQVIREYFDRILFNVSDASEKDFFQKGIENIFDIVRTRYGLSISNNDVLTLNCFISDYQKNYVSVQNWSHKNKVQLSLLHEYLKDHKNHSFNIAKEIGGYLHSYLELDILPVAETILSFYLAGIVDKENNRKRIAVIIAHGFSTASSIAEAANQFLGSYIFDAIDMPMNLDVHAIVKKLNTYLNGLRKFEELFLLVDMGSLEDIYKGIQYKQANIGIINNISTSKALEIGNGIIMNQSIEEVFENVVRHSNIRYHIENNQAKKNIILSSCASGIGTAEKLRGIINDSLPVDVDIEVQTYNYNELVDKGIQNRVFDDYTVLFIVGTLNPNIEEVIFIPIEELILSDSFVLLYEPLKEIMSSDQLEQFKKNILKNFSLSNIMSNLTILNPNKLLEHVADALDRLQTALGKNFTSNTSFGLYVHISCLIERLVIGREIEDYNDLGEFEVQQKKFINLVKQVFKEVEDFYGVDISVPEIGYIYDYIQHD